MSSNSTRILIVDDNPINRRKLGLAVKRLGYASAAVDSGLAAIDRLHQERFDLVLLDIVMPGMDGFEVLDVLKQHPVLKEIPVLVISALDDVSAVVRAVTLGAEDHLNKDVDPILLNARIDASLSKKRLRDNEIEYLLQVEALTNAAAAIESDQFDPTALSLENVRARDDALGQLARVFSTMAKQVYDRERDMQRQIQELSFEIDRGRQQQQVESITGTDYFLSLRARADTLRARLNGCTQEPHE